MGLHGDIDALDATATDPRRADLLAAWCEAHLGDGPLPPPDAAFFRESAEVSLEECQAYVFNDALAGRATGRADFGERALAWIDALSTFTAPARGWYVTALAIAPTGAPRPLTPLVGHGAVAVQATGDAGRARTAVLCTEPAGARWEVLPARAGELWGCGRAPAGDSRRRLSTGPRPRAGPDRAPPRPTARSSSAW